MALQRHLVLKMLYVAACWAVMLPVTSAQEVKQATTNRKVQAVIGEVDKTCREKTVYMIGPEKAKRLAELIVEKKDN